MTREASTRTSSRAVELPRLPARAHLGGALHATPFRAFHGRAGNAQLCVALATKMYRTSPLKGVWQHAPYFHDGSAATLEAVASTYNVRRGLGLTAPEIADLAQYLKSL